MLTTPGMIWSVHDVTPRTMPRAELIVDLLTAAGRAPLCILVVPAGGEWCAAQVATLKAWAEQGHILAAHGWSHKCGPPRRLYHRLHSMLMSRDSAEHLGHPTREVAAIMEQSHRWFSDIGLVEPELYVPPAWALGDMTLAECARMGYRWVEVLTGVYDTVSARFHRLPLVGFEADTRIRTAELRSLNRANLLLGAVAQRPVRVAVHPNDFDLALAGQLRRCLCSDVPSISLVDL